MSLSNHGDNILNVAITNISSRGIWLLVQQKELFLSYRDFPWFKDQKVSAITNVQEQSPGHYYWPELDVDLTGEIMARPERFPLTMK